MPFNNNPVQMINSVLYQTNTSQQHTEFYLGGLRALEENKGTNCGFLPFSSVNVRVSQPDMHSMQNNGNAYPGPCYETPAEQQPNMPTTTWIHPG